MFDIGFSELVVISLIALIVLGPKRLPEAARATGRWIGKLRRFIAEVKQDLDHEMHQAELAELRNLKQELDDTRRLMENTSGQLIQGLTGTTSAAAGTIHPNETPASAQAAAPAKRPRAKSRKKSRPGRKHGAARRIPER